MKKTVKLVSALLCALLLAGCGASKAPEAAPAETAAPTAAEETAAVTAATQETEPALSARVLPDGEYTVDFETDSGMFRANEACDGKGTLTVKDGVQTLHVSLQSKKIVNLYLCFFQAFLVNFTLIYQYDRSAGYKLSCLDSLLSNY